MGSQHLSGGWRQGSTLCPTIKTVPPKESRPQPAGKPNQERKPEGNLYPSTQVLEALEVKAIAHEALKLREWHSILEYDKRLHITTRNVATTP
ncbi:hypothetical protein NG796_16360 [Laspinema sp. A4]|uniref:hypothetical protein n=1 Tax=Laspinema sp. D2d TaxID=2953686 RepID=UPI0021BB2538|nr:hypothetical protein [Laspinema sp. D2d]MCT7984844.1 hypothetical protein [Laspinema sp. D2d]